MKNIQIAFYGTQLDNLNLFDMKIEIEWNERAENLEEWMEENKKGRDKEKLKF
jgi:hypothetical protein